MDQKINEKTISIKLDATWLERLSALAKRGDISRHQLMKNMIDVGLEQLGMYRMVGFFKLGLLLRQLGKEHKWKVSGVEKPVPITLPENKLKLVDKYADELEMSRHLLMRNMVYIGIEEVETFQRIGAFHINDACKWLSNSFKGIITDGQKAFQATHGH